jgi:hypothetical protein
MLLRQHHVVQVTSSELRDCLVVVLLQGGVVNARILYGVSVAIGCLG